MATVYPGTLIPSPTAKAEETTTRTVLRRKICKELRMPFFRRVSSTYSTVAANSTTAKIIDTKLTQPDATWNGSWFYNITTGEVSYIRAFTANDDTFRLESPCANSPIGNTYEIHSIWNANEVHDAINEAIRQVRRAFPETVTDESIVLQENTMTYPLNLSRFPWVINKIWVENPMNMVRGNVVNATESTVTLSEMAGDVTTTWRISIYAGTGVGQVRAPIVVTGNSFTVIPWDVIPDATSKYAFFDSSDELRSWSPFNDFRLDSEEYPDTLYINNLYDALYGMRLRIEMLSVSPDLTTEASTTNVPSEYVKAKACSILHGQALSNTKADKDTHYAEYKRYMDEADAYVVRNAIHTGGVRFRTPTWEGQENYAQRNDPLNWSR